MYLFNKEEAQKIIQLSNPQNDSAKRGYKIQLDLGILKDLNISNLVETFCETSRKLFLMKKGIDFGPSIVMIKGGAIHTLIEKIFNKYINDGLTNNDNMQDLIHELNNEHRLMEIIWEGDRLFQLKSVTNDQDHYEHVLGEIKKTLKDITQIEIQRFLNIEDFSSDIKIIELEDYVDGSSFNFGNGKIDAVVKCKDIIGICDLKSGSSYKQNISAKYQITLYALMIEAQYNIDVNWGAIIFPYEKIDKNTKRLRREPEKDIFHIDKEMRIATIEHIAKVNQIIQNDVLPPMCHWQCNYCNVKDICERGL